MNKGLHEAETSGKLKCILLYLIAIFQASSPFGFDTDFILTVCTHFRINY